MSRCVRITLASIFLLAVMSLVPPCTLFSKVCCGAAWTIILIAVLTIYVKGKGG